MSLFETGKKNTAIPQDGEIAAVLSASWLQIYSGYCLAINIFEQTADEGY